MPNDTIDHDIIAPLVASDIETADAHFAASIAPDIARREKLFSADAAYYAEKFKKLGKNSTVTATDIADAVNWAMPALMRIFFGGRDVIRVAPRTVEDVEPAETMHTLVNWQLANQLDAFGAFSKWFRDALVHGCGVMKVGWRRTVERTGRSVIATGAELAVMEAAADVEVISASEAAPDLFDVTYETDTVTENRPELIPVAPADIRIDPAASSVKTASFVAHRRIMSASELRTMQSSGMYENVEAAMDAAGAADKPAGADVKDASRARFIVHECYGDWDADGTGIARPLIVTMLGTTIIRAEANPYSRPPVFTLSPAPATGIFSPGFADMLEHVQDLKTALMRQLVINVALNNDPKQFIDDAAVNTDDLLGDAQYIRVRSAGRALSDLVRPVPVQPLAPWTFSLLEYVEAMKETRTGITRYNQGVDADSLNKTATGINLIMGAANQRLELIARNFAETGVKEIFSFLVEANQRFMDDTAVIRLTGKPLVIRPDDIAGSFDMDVNAALGTGTEAEAAANLQHLLGMYPEFISLGIAKPKNVYTAAKKLIGRMGFKDAEDFLTDPDDTGGGHALI